MKHGGQKAGRNLLAAIFHNGFTGTVVKCDVTALPRLASRRTGMPRAWPISKTLSMNCLPFIVLNIGQICPNIKRKINRLFSRLLSEALRGDGDTGRSAHWVHWPSRVFYPIIS